MADHAVEYPQKLGPYELVRHIATGGMAEVYLARRSGPHGFSKTVAVKRILPQLVRDPDFVAMFVDEARVCAQLSHPNLVQVFDFGEADSELYMAMEFVDGTTCAKAVRRAAAQSEPMPIEAGLHIIMSVLRGLEYAHAAVDLDGVPLGLVHRDVSPGNILIARSGAVKLGDFGIARADEFERRTEEGQLKGKLGYMSPEQVTAGKIDARSDLFTLGIVLAEILVSRPLFGTGNELDVLIRIRDADLSIFERNNKNVPGELRSIVRKGLARNPMDRFQSATEFVEAIEDLVRQKRLNVGAPRLVSWLEHAGLIATSRSGEHNLDVLRSGAPVRVTPRPAEGPARAGAHRRESPQPFPAPGAAALSTGHERGRDRPPGGQERVGGREPSAEPRQTNISPDIYRVVKGERVIGPISYATLLELLVTGQANSDTLVSRDRGPFRPARDLPELARLLVSPGLCATPEMSGQPKDVWTLDRATHPGRLFDLAIRRETGLLVARQDNRQKKIFLVDGEATFTASTDKHELLGQQLIARGMAMPLEIDMALALCPRYGGRLGDALVGLGVLRPMELYRALVAQTQERFMDLLAWKRGRLELVRGVKAEGETILYGTSPMELVACGVVRGYPDLEIEALMAPFLQHDVKPIQAIDTAVQQLHLVTREANVLLTIDRATTIQVVVNECTESGVAGYSEVLRGIFIGLSARILVSTGWPPPPERPSVPTKKMGVST